jgi:hypothetical protein
MIYLPGFEAADLPGDGGRGFVIYFEKTDRR